VLVASRDPRFVRLARFLLGGRELDVEELAAPERLPDAILTATADIVILDGADAVLITHEHPDHMAPDRFAALGRSEVYTTRGVAEKLEGTGAHVHVVGDGDRFEVAGFDVAVVGELHAVVHPEWPRLGNVGFLVDDHTFHPGDAFNVPGVAGELAVARAAAAVASGRVDAVLAGGVDELDPLVVEMLEALGDEGVRGEGATFLVLESETAAHARGATVLGRLAGAVWRSLPARPWGVGRRIASRAIVEALARAGRDAPGWVYASASGDAPRDAWESSVLSAALGSARPPAVSLGGLVGHHAGLGALHVAAAAWTARAGLLPDGAGGKPARVSGCGLVHGLGRGGGQVALIVEAA